MVLQRDQNNICHTYFSVSIPGEICISKGQIHEISCNKSTRRICLTGIWTGGPYEITLRVGEYCITFNDIYVGDVWLLGGQSNMEGYGFYHHTLPHLNLTPEIRMFSANDVWNTAEPRIHRNELSRRDYLRTRCWQPAGYWQTQGVGPGYFFAEEMHRRTGVPQGLIPCALGGSHLSQWEPDSEETNLYDIMLERFHACGSHVRGIFWHQGCGETTNPEDAEKFTERMKYLINALRRDTGDPVLPFVQVQLFFHAGSVQENDKNWNLVRESQRKMAQEIPGVDTIAITNGILTDGIHLHSESQRQVGIQAAESMFHLCFDPDGITSKPFPQPARIYVPKYTDEWGSILAIQYHNLHGTLTSPDRPTGFDLSYSPETLDVRAVFRVDLHDDTVYIRHWLQSEQLQKLYLFYFFGNTTYANITDSTGRPLPALGPIPLEKYL